MASEPEFLVRVKKTLEVDERLQKLFDKGKLDGERFKKNKESLNRMLQQLKREHLTLISETLAEADLALAKTDSERERGILNNEEYYPIKNRLNLLKNELESDKDAVDLCDGDEYISCLRKLMDEKKYEHYGPPKIDPKSIMGGKVYRKGELDGKRDKDNVVTVDNPMPFWVMGAAGFYVIAAFAFGAVYSTHFMVVFPGVVAIAIGAGAAITHLASTLAGVESASFTRAFKCFIFWLILATVCGGLIVLLSSFMSSPLGSPMTFEYSKASASDRMMVYVFLTLVFMLMPIWCIRAVYDATYRQAILAGIIQFVLVFLAGTVFRTYLHDLTGGADIFSTTVNETRRLRIGQ